MFTSLIVVFVLVILLIVIGGIFGRRRPPPVVADSINPPSQYPGQTGMGAGPPAPRYPPPGPF